MFKYQLPLQFGTEVFPEWVGTPPVVRIFSEVPLLKPYDTTANLDVQIRNLFAKHKATIYHHALATRQQHQNGGVGYTKVRKTLPGGDGYFDYSINNGQEILNIHLWPVTKKKSGGKNLLVLYKGNRIAAFPEEQLQPDDKGNFDLKPIVDKTLTRSSWGQHGRKLTAAQLRTVKDGPSWYFSTIYFEKNLIKRRDRYTMTLIDDGKPGEGQQSQLEFVWSPIMNGRQGTMYTHRDTFYIMPHPDGTSTLERDTRGEYWAVPYAISATGRKYYQAFGAVVSANSSVVRTYANVTTLAGGTYTPSIYSTTNNLLPDNVTMTETAYSQWSSDIDALNWFEAQQAYGWVMYEANGLDAIYGTPATGTGEAAAASEAHYGGTKNLPTPLFRQENGVDHIDITVVPLTVEKDFYSTNESETEIVRWSYNGHFKTFELTRGSDIHVKQSAAYIISYPYRLNTGSKHYFIDRYFGETGDFWGFEDLEPGTLYTPYTSKAMPTLTGTTFSGQFLWCWLQISEGRNHIQGSYLSRQNPADAITIQMPSGHMADYHSTVPENENYFFLYCNEKEFWQPLKRVLGLSSIDDIDGMVLDMDLDFIKKLA